MCYELKNSIRVENVTNEGHFESFVLQVASVSIVEREPISKWVAMFVAEVTRSRKLFFITRPLESS